MCGYSCTYIMQFCFNILYVHRDGHKDKGNYKGPIEYDTVAEEAASIKDSPTEVSYTATTQAPQYHYARTGPMKVKVFQVYVCAYNLANISYIHCTCNNCNMGTSVLPIRMYILAYIRILINSFDLRCKGMLRSYTVHII